MSPSSFAACDAAALENRLLSVDWQMLSQGSELGLQLPSACHGWPAVASSPLCHGASGGKGRITVAKIAFESSLVIVWRRLGFSYWQQRLQAYQIS